jgi:hypothetical protein
MRPLLFGYLHPSTPASDGDVAAYTGILAAYAEAEGFALCTVFVEMPGSDAAFTALLTAMRRYECWAVAVPSREHLARVFLAVQRLEYEAGARVLVVRPGSGPGAA